MNKPALYLELKPSTKDVSCLGPDPADARSFFDHDDRWLQEVRHVFDWISGQQGGQRIQRSAFRERLPDVYRKFPSLASSFIRMDANGDCWLEWKEFATFCLQDERLLNALRRAASLAVYGVCQDGSRTYKDAYDPARLCEIAASPPLLPWEVSHLVEWRVDGLEIGQRGAPTKHNGAVVRPGASIVSSVFRAGGVQGSLRFWPAGYWSVAQKMTRSKSAGGAEDLHSGGCCLPPSTTSWCCVGLRLPSNSHLTLRFFVGDSKSERRECFWSEGSHVHQVWSPPSAAPSPEVLRGSALVVGVEIFQNLESPHKNVEQVGRPLVGEARRGRRPLLAAAHDARPTPKNCRLVTEPEAACAKSVPEISLQSPQVARAPVAAKLAEVPKRPCLSSSAHERLQQLRQLASPTQRFAFSSSLEARAL